MKKISRELTFLPFFLILFGLTSCGGSVGIDKPISYKERQVIITSAQVTDTYSFASRTFRPESKTDSILVLKAEVSPPEEEINLSSWMAKVVDESGRTDRPAASGTQQGIIEGEQKLIIEWIFTVSSDAQSLTLLLGEHEIDLKGLISDESSE
jgi:hypothetical protein